ncbi:MAG: sarcosine oxidase subunit delta [Alphaproteobacteria bacterium]|nr:sarcosine oxidase subunit delta [Alphaproteobacteria bacterium]|tara:strand:+ start:445 stop:783 length:339 start_codon:yes stop_codon:yes gene_type:complete
MLLIPCPWCGPRDEIEFGCGGEAHIARPENPDELSDEAWADYLFNRANPKGPFAERWVHSHGCRRWFNVVRDTATNEILAVYEMGAPRPKIGSPPVLASPDESGTTSDGESS